MRLSLILASALLVSLLGCGERSAEAPPAAPRGQPTVEMPARLTPRAVCMDRRAATMALALADGSDAAWPARLEAMRQIRRARPVGLADQLVDRIRLSRDDLEQAVAIDVLAAAYPNVAAAKARTLADELAGEPVDERRLAVSLLRYRIAPCYALALDQLTRGNHPEALFAARALIIACGSPIVPELERRAQGPGELPTLARLLASAASGAADVEGDARALAESSWPRAAVAVFAEHYHALAVPTLRSALAAEACDGRAEAAAALGELADAEAAPAILKLLPDASARERPAFLLALGRMRCAEALPQLLEASRDPAERRGEDGATTWPLAQAALAGLARMPGEESYDALIAALARTARPAVVGAAAQALAERGDNAALPALDAAAAALGRDGKVVDAAAVAEARDRLAGEAAAHRDLIAYIVRYAGGDDTFDLLADQPLLPVDGAGQLLKSTLGAASVSEESIALSREDIAAAIQLRNSRRLEHLGYGGEPIDEVDLLAR